MLVDENFVVTFDPSDQTVTIDAASNGYVWFDVDAVPSLIHLLTFAHDCWQKEIADVNE